MQKLSIKQIVEFRGKSDKTKKNFAKALKSEKTKKNTDGGGNYWITSLSAISNAYKTNSLQPIIDKKEELRKKHKETGYARTKNMYKRNIDILEKFEDHDFKKSRPSKGLKFLRKYKADSVLTVKGLQVQADPNHVFTFEKDGVEEIGAIWFVAQLEGFRKDELGMFTDILYRYLKTHYSEDYILNSRYCIAVDVFKNTNISYSELEKGEIPKLLDSTLVEIGKLV